MPNKTVERNFNEFKKHIFEYRQEVDAIFAQYRSKVEHEKARLLPETLEQEKLKWQTQARQELSACYNALDSVYNNLDRTMFVDELTKYVTAPADPKLVETLRAYREFSIPMSRIELDAFIRMAVSGPCAYANLRILATVAKQGNFEITVPTVESYEDTIKSFDRFIIAAERYVPGGYTVEGREIGRQYMHKTNHLFNLDSVENVILQQNMRNISQQIDDARAKWCAAFVPEVKISVSPTATPGEVDKAIDEAVQEHIESVNSAAAGVKVSDKSLEHAMSDYGAGIAESENESKQIREAYGIKG